MIGSLGGIGRSRAVAWSATLLAACAASAGAALAERADGLYYEMEAGRVVITNTPGTGDARPLPGWDRPSTREMAATGMGTSRWDPYIHLAATDAGISPALLKAVARVESGFDPRARSPKGALGLMQLMPETARELGVTDPLDAWQSLRGGARHLRGLLDTFGDVDLALAAYNAGAGAVRRHGGIPAYAETRDYVRKVRRLLVEDRPDAPAPPGAERRNAAPASAVRLRRGADGSFVISN